MAWLNGLFGKQNAPDGETDPEVATISEDVARQQKRSILIDMLELKAAIADGIDKTLADPGPDQYMDLWRDWNCEDAKKHAAEACSAVYACIQRYLMGSRSVRWVVRKRKGKIMVDDPNHRIAKLLRYPNRNLSQRRMLDRVTLDLLYDGTAYWRKVRISEGKKQITKELWPINSGFVRPVPDEINFLKHYEIHKKSRQRGKPFPNDKKALIVKPEDMVVFILESAESVYYGKGPVEIGKRVIEADSNALRWWGNQIRKGTRKEGILSFKHDFSDDAFKDVDKLLRQQVLGPQNVGGIMLLGQEHTYTPLGQKPVELDYGNSRESLRREVAAIFAVPPPMIGDFGSAGGYNNMQIARLIFWLDTMIPFLDVQKDALNFHLLNAEIPEDDWDNYEIDYDLSGVDALVQIFGNRLDQALKMRKLGVPLDEIMQAAGIPVGPIPGGNKGYLEQNLVPVEDLGLRKTPQKRDVPSDPSQFLESETIKDPDGEASDPNRTVPGSPNIQRDLQQHTLERRSL